MIREFINIILTRTFRFKRAITLITVVAIILAAFLAVRGAMPFMPVFGTSMEPELHAGNLILIKDKEPEEVKVGDIIVYNVPPAIQDFYNYPPVVAHRVIEVRDTQYGIAWRTKGDNAGEDPFTVRANDLRGTVSHQVPLLGFPFLFLQSQQGLMFVIIALSLFALYLYANDISRGGQKIHRGLFAPVIKETMRDTETLAQRMDGTEKVMAQTQEALSSFAIAMAEYAEHLRSHTSAIQGLAEASHELKRGAAEQNKALERIVEALEHRKPLTEEMQPPEKPAAPPPVKGKYPPGCVRSRQQVSAGHDIFGAG
ncbi:MAG TPA: signal peptidase I [Dehalococcoidia bacterium]|nr:signal peptidase I [Dehalococcoidia bacterium]